MSKDNNIKNIFLIGTTGSGVSTLGNVLVNKDGNFEEVFKTERGLTSITNEIETAEFEKNGIRYRVIDTPGYLNANLTLQQWAKKMSEAFQAAPEGINQILFVFKSVRFSKEQVELYNFLKLIDKNINQYITVVATKFESFKNRKKCQENYEDLKDETKVNSEIASIFREVHGLIMVDNSSEKKSKEKSREKLINHLVANCQDNFQLINVQGGKKLADKNKSKVILIFFIMAFILGLLGIFSVRQREKAKKSRPLSKQVVR
ncbi:GTPase [endosymbiont GvMRE of Glomus versiforme]|uniref:GTPase n=1 Tax=endosymbiont GvMRE of Glomus versiforme TaxID=2039283 RepID=UPI000EBBD581|nr:GTPase [endosymbiont GvMRE of Glomus versiforme]RHZ35573.1 GTPase, IMAP family member 7 [endosymbiont GvMRE of Glomus versiforme]